MHKAELVAKIAEQAGLTKAEAQTALNALTDNLTDALARNETVSLIGFGTFSSSSGNWASALRISSVRPSAKYSSSAPLVRARTPRPVPPCRSRPAPMSPSSPARPSRTL